MTKKIFIVFAASLLFAGSLTWGIARSGASSTPEQEALQVANEYFDAVIAGNAEKAKKYVQDIRFEDDAALLNGYKQMMKNDPIRYVKVLSVNASEPEKIILTVEYESEKQGVQQNDLPLVKSNNQWMFQFTDIKEVKAKTQ